MATGTNAVAQPRQGGTLQFVVEPEPSTLVSIDNSFGATSKIGPKVTEGLLTYDLELRPQPQLATSWSISSNELRYTFHLRSGVTRHDGQPFTADDVAFSILTLKRVHPRGRGTVATPDPLTAVIVLSKRAPYLISALTAGGGPDRSKAPLSGHGCLSQSQQRASDRYRTVRVP
jgi:peptide/nickel transport system substrate-binding protein